MGHKPIFDARDPWTASYLSIMDVPFIGATLDTRYGNNKIVWTFDNSDDAAWMLANEWRQEENATVNGPALMRAYREMSRVAAEARAAHGGTANGRRYAA